MKHKLITLLLLISALFILHGCSSDPQSSCSMTSDNKCPASCTTENDIDCKNEEAPVPATCGDGQFDPAIEKCDDSVVGHECPTSVDTCENQRIVSKDACSKWELTGDATHCSALCQPTTEKYTANLDKQDQCCPPGADASTDADCIKKKELALEHTGEACTANSDCGTDGFCITPAINPNFKNGYCSGKIEDTSKFACPENTAAHLLNGQTYCFKSCTGATCTPDRATDGYICSMNSVCEPSCGDGKFDKTTEKCDDSVPGHTCPSTLDCEAFRLALPNTDPNKQFLHEPDTSNGSCQTVCKPNPAQHPGPNLDYKDSYCDPAWDITTDADCTNKHVLQLKHTGLPCGFSIGANTDCGTEGYCLTRATIPTFQGGYCTGKITDPQKYECPKGTTPHELYGTTYCFQSCTGSTCSPLDRSSQGYTCSSNSICEPTCGDGKLDSATEKCDTDITSGLGKCPSYAPVDCEATRRAAADNTARCAAYKITNAGTCGAICEVDDEHGTPITTLSMTPDSCCPTGGDITTDADCTNKHPLSLENVGENCTDDSTCGTDGKCLKEAEYPLYTGGYCTGEITDAKKYECPTGTKEYTLSGKKYCFKDCTDTSVTCGSLQACDATEKVCVSAHECLFNSDCTNNKEVCRANSSGVKECTADKVDPMKAGLNEACHEDSDCDASAPKCLVYDSVTNSATDKKGICTLDCTNNEKNCPGGSFQCSAAPGHGGAKYCMNDCTTTDSCSTINSNLSCIDSPNLPKKKICYATKIDAKIGTACTMDSDCGPEGVCRIQTVKGEYQGGYCTVVKGTRTCPAGSKTVLFGKECLAECDTTTPCRTGYTCDTRDKVCKTNPIKNTRCGSGEKLWPITGEDKAYCATPNSDTNVGKELGEECKSYKECKGGEHAVCVLYDKKKQLGYCSIDCNYDPNKACGTNAFCEKLGKNYFCVKKCTDVNSCGGANGQFECTNKSNNTMMDPMLASGEKICKAIPKQSTVLKLGEPCTTNEECGAGNKCLFEQQGKFKGGYCTTTCAGVADNECPTGSICTLVTGTYRNSFCMKACTPATGGSPDCRTKENYACVEISSGAKQYSCISM